jgi:hypothetical protein
MCWFIPKDHPNRDALIAFAQAQASMMEEALSKWTEEDWAAAEAAVAEDEKSHVSNRGLDHI